jgi:hypothetical protein
LSYDYFGADSLPQAYDVVFCNFPYDENLDEPGPVDHPCLVIDAMTDDDGNPWVRLLCGTSKPARWDQRYFEVPYAQGRYAGLTDDTRFNFRKIARIPWAREYFKNDDPPKVRPLPEHSVRNFGFDAAEYSRDYPDWKPFDV